MLLVLELDGIYNFENILYPISRVTENFPGTWLEGQVKLKFVNIECYKYEVRRYPWLKTLKASVETFKEHD